MKTTNYKKIILALTLFPAVTFAATFRDAVLAATDIGRVLMPLLFSVALAWFIWGVVDFIRSADNPEQRKKGKQRILWGIIALTAMIGYLGLTTVLTNTFFQKEANVLPQLCNQETC